MIIYNVKVNKRLILKSVLLIMLIICITLGAIGIYNICKNINQNKEYNLIDDSIPSSEYALISKDSIFRICL